MSWQKLKINNLRNLQPLIFEPATSISFISGNNGAGKTSLLEALCLISTGRSFHGKKRESVINSEQTTLTIYGEYQKAESHSLKCGIGINKDGQLHFKINTVNQRNFELLTEQFCLKVITPDVFTSVIGTSEQRRNLIDWQLFHVEHLFKKIKYDYKKVIKQRNASLKLFAHRKNTDRAQIKNWDVQLVDLSNKLDLMRQNAISTLNEQIKNFSEATGKWLKELDLSHRYYRGWPKEKELASLLESNFEKDVEKGFTQYGAHRFDFTFLLNQQTVAECLSRGELKTLAVASQLAQVNTAVIKGRAVVVLIDDLFAELDYKHAIWCIETLLSLSNVQAMITGINIPANIKQRFAGKDIKWFHVEHGKIFTKPLLTEQ